MNVKHWHFILSGYSQNYATPTGCERIWGALDDMLAETGPGTRVLYFPWNAPFEQIAEMVKRCSAQGTCVRVYAYSWGAGYGFITLTKELNRRGIGVRHAVLCDPVWRRPGIPAALNWVGSLSSVWAKGKLDIPASVDEVTWAYQRNNHPDGDEPVAKGAKTRINPGVKLLDAVHASADDSEWFYDTSLRVALEPAVPGEKPEVVPQAVPGSPDEVKVTGGTET
jgi:hypothetical protein